MLRNPLKLPRKTHVLAVEHIRRFAHDEKRSRVFVYDRRGGRVRAADVDEYGPFNVNGVWSDQAEKLMGPIETAFWNLLDELDTSGRISNQDVISEYFSLWYARAWYSEKYTRMLSEPLVGITPIEFNDEFNDELNDEGKVKVRIEDKIVTVTPEELLEYRGVGFYTADLKASLRSGSWVLIRCMMDKCRQALHGVRWGLVECRETSLVLPDCTSSLDIPIGPHTFLHGYKNGERYLDRTAVPGIDVRGRNQDLFSGKLYAVVAHSRDVLDLFVQATSRG